MCENNKKRGRLYVQIKCHSTHFIRFLARTKYRIKFVAILSFIKGMQKRRGKEVVNFLYILRFLLYSTEHTSDYLPFFMISFLSNILATTTNFIA